MNRWNLRIWLGGGLVVLGILMLLQRFGLFPGLTGIFFGLLFLAGAAWVLIYFAANLEKGWWAAIPGFALAGIAAEILLGDVAGGWGGSFFLAALGLAFFAVYISGRERWWALIPGGLFVTLAAITVLDNAFGVGETGGVLFLGFGLTFMLVAVLASLRWAWIPSVVLLVIGAIIGLSSTGTVNYIWPAALILGGLLLILQFVRRPR